MTPHLLPGLVLPLEDAVTALPVHGRAMLAETAVTFSWLDIGAGLPEWPPDFAT